MSETKNSRLRTRCLGAIRSICEAVCVNVHVNVYLKDHEAERLAREKLAGVDLEGVPVEYHVCPPLSCEEVRAFWRNWGGHDPDPYLAERMHAHVCSACDACWDALVLTHGGALALAVGASKVVMRTWNSHGKILL